MVDRVVQAVLKLVLEPVFAADFEPVSHRFRPERRAHDAIAEIRRFGAKGYRVLDADIEACFDRIDHAALMDRGRCGSRTNGCCGWSSCSSRPRSSSNSATSRTLTGRKEASSSLAANALSVPDERLHAPWKPGTTMGAAYQRSSRRRDDPPNWRLVRYADDFVVLTDGTKPTSPNCASRSLVCSLRPSCGYPRPRPGSCT
jgi:RNA-directed DNA polymerase